MAGSQSGARSGSRKFTESAFRVGLPEPSNQRGRYLDVSQRRLCQLQKLLGTLLQHRQQAGQSTQRLVVLCTRCVVLVSSCAWRPRMTVRLPGSDSSSLSHACGTCELSARCSIVVRQRCKVVQCARHVWRMWRLVSELYSADGATWPPPAPRSFVSATSRPFVVACLTSA